MHEHKNLMGALLKAKAAMGTLTKDAKNPHFKSTYASLAAVVDVLRQPLTDSGIVYIESPVPELEPGRIAIDLTICHAESGESITYRSPVMVAQQQTPQAIGSALTYARRYQLMTVFGLAPEDDDGNESTKAQTPRQQPQRQAPPVTDVTPTNGNGHTPTTEAPATDVDMVSTVQLKALHAAGTDLYGKEWDTKRPQLVKGATKARGTFTSANELTKAEADKLIQGMRDRIAKRNFDAEHSDVQPQEQPAEDGALWQPEPVTA